MVVNSKFLHRCIDTQMFFFHGFYNHSLELRRISFVWYSFWHSKTPHLLDSISYCLTNGVQFRDTLAVFCLQKVWVFMRVDSNSCGLWFLETTALPTERIRHEKKRPCAAGQRRWRYWGVTAPFFCRQGIRCKSYELHPTRRVGSFQTAASSCHFRC